MAVTGCITIKNIKKKHMKKISIIVLAAALFIGCTAKDDFKVLSDFSKPEIFTPSLFTMTETAISRPIPININNFSSLIDASQGVLSRNWTIQDGAKYLLPTFERKDSLNLDAFIDTEIGSSNWRETVHVLFQQEGESVVTLRNTFDSPVNFLGTEAVEQEDGTWQLTTQLTYDVYANLNTEATISNAEDTEILATLGAEDNPSSDDITGFTDITIEAGESLTFTDISTIGRPDERLWAFEGGTPATSTEEKQVVTFNRLGEYVVELTTLRDRRGTALNPAQQTKTIPAVITIIPSTKPYEIANNAQAIDDDDEIAGTNIISFNVNGEIEAVNGVEGDFVVNVQNVGFDQNFTVTLARKDNDDSTAIELILDQPILNSDTVTLSYSGTGITSIDSRTLLPFTDVPVNAVNKNLLTNASNPSMENPSNNERQVNTQGYFLFVGGGGNNLDNARNADGSLQINRSTERASDGNASIKFDAEMPLGAGFLSLSNTIISNSAVPAGDYKLTWDMYIEDGSDFDAIFNVIQQGTPRTQLVSINAPGTGQWFTVEREFSAGAVLGGNIIFNFRNQDNPGISGRQVFYIDNLKVIALEPR